MVKKQVYTHGVYKVGQNYQLGTIFAHSSNGLPGVELIGFGNWARLIKEKIIYLVKVQKIKIPLKRYVLCFEEGPGLKNTEYEQIKWLEFPLLLVLLSLSDNLSLSSLEECLSCGYLDIKNKIIHQQLSWEQLVSFQQKVGRPLKYITVGEFLRGPDIYSIEANDLLNFKVPAYRI